jgi:UDP-N-acetylglucosamine 1-carboxyvinyltransferase
MSAATLAHGKTVIHCAATEPEIVDLGRFLNALGADITGLGTRVIEIVGVDRLGSACHTVIPDRIEAGTLLIAAAIGGSATVEGIETAHVTAVLDALVATGATVTAGLHSVTVQRCERPRPIALTARPYPGIPTDLQAQFMALVSIAAGQSTIRDTVFPDRFAHVDELSRLGAQIERHGSMATVRGVPGLSGTTVRASDLRASAALVLAGLAAEGMTVIRHIGHLDRGYEALDQKLAQLGARVSRLPTAGAARAVRKRAHAALHVHSA